MPDTYLISYLMDKGQWVLPMTISNIYTVTHLRNLSKGPSLYAYCESLNIVFYQVEINPLSLEFCPYMSYWEYLPSFSIPLSFSMKLLG